MLDSFTSDTMLKDQVVILFIILYLQFIDTQGSKYMMMMCTLQVTKSRMKIVYIQGDNVSHLTTDKGYNTQ